MITQHDGLKIGVECDRSRLPLGALKAIYRTSTMLGPHTGIDVIISLPLDRSFLGTRTNV